MAYVASLVLNGLWMRDEGFSWLAHTNEFD